MLPPLLGKLLSTKQPPVSLELKLHCPGKGGRPNEQKKNPIKTTLHENITTFSYTVAAPREGVEQGKGEKGETRPTCFSQNPPKGLRLSRQDSNNFSHKVEDLMNRVFPLMPWKNYTQKETKKIRFSTYLQKQAPQPHNQGGGAASDGVWEGGLCPTSSSSKVPIPQQAGEHGSRCQSKRGGRHVPGLDRSPSVHPQLGVPVICGGDHLVGVAVLGAERQLVRGLHAVVDLCGG